MGYHFWWGKFFFLMFNFFFFFFAEAVTPECLKVLISFSKNFQLIANGSTVNMKKEVRKINFFFWPRIKKKKKIKSRGTLSTSGSGNSLENIYKNYSQKIRQFMTDLGVFDFLFLKFH